MHSFLRDLSFGVRVLLKNPGFTFVAVLSLAVGIGINSTVFGFVNAIFLKSISVSNSEGLVYVFAGDQRNPFRTSSYYAYTEFRTQNDVFSGLAAYAAPPMLMTKGEHTEEIRGVLLAAVGIVIGVLLAWGTTRFVSGFLYGVSPVDPVVFFGVAALLSLVALIASVVPALRAVKANPVDALRYY